MKEFSEILFMGAFYIFAFWLFEVQPEWQTAALLALVAASLWAIGHLLDARKRRSV